jgi:transcriptional regulator with XRE-family HTH domain/sRNA-binding regulator protein Hfq
MSALRAIREKKGFNLSQLASRAGISARVLTEYEEGRQTIPLAHARLLAKALWVQIEDLMPPAGSVSVAAQPVQSASVPTQTAPLQPLPPAPATSTAYSDEGNGGQVAQGAYANGARGVYKRDAGSLPPARTPQAVGQGRPGRERRPSTPPPPLTEGQLQELVHLASRLDVTREQIEERVGRPLAGLSRSDAKEWVKRLRAMADEIAPSARSRYGRWPESQEDREAVYLAHQQAEGAPLTFKLFNGESFTGNIIDFSPYTITIASESGEVVLRKLAVAYYSREGRSESVTATGESGPPREHDHERDDAHQPLDRGTDSDRAGVPDEPEIDNMDEDRGV